MNSNDSVARFPVAVAMFVLAAGSSITVAALSWTRDWLRIIVAPAWIAGAEASGDVNHPNALVVLIVLLVFATALALLARHATSGGPPTMPPAPGAAAASLIILLAALVMELTFAQPIARALRNLTGVPGDVGSEFPAFLALRLAPAICALGVVAVAATALATRFQRRLMRALQVSLWILNVALILGCFSWFFSPHVP